MNKKDFLNGLSFLLSDLPEADKEEILYDYEEHFRSGVENGKTEEEIARALGDPRLIAKQYRAEMKIEKAHNDKSISNIFSAVFATLALGFFNVVVVLGPFLAVFGVIIGLFAASIGISVGGLGVIAASFAAGYLPLGLPFSAGFPLLMFTGLGLSCFGILFFIAVFYISKYFYIFTIKYLKWNMRVIKGGDRA